MTQNQADTTEERQRGIRLSGEILDMVEVIQKAEHRPSLVNTVEVIIRRYADTFSNGEDKAA